MPGREEIARALTGAWLLWRTDPTAMRWFDLTVEGFWRSFFAAVLVAPFYVFMLTTDYMANGLPASLPLVVLVRSLAYVVDWAAFPLVAILLVRLFGLEHRYVALIVADNWASVLQAAALTTAVAVSLVLPMAVAALVVLGTFITVVFYQWLVARQALETTGGIAGGFVAADLLTGILVDRMVTSLLYAS